MDLFIDTNIYLTFYHFTNDDLEELKKLLAAIKSKKIVVYLPEQVEIEFKRNREQKISEALDKFDSMKLPNQYPQFCKGYDEYAELTDIESKYQSLKNGLSEKLRKDIRMENLAADLLIKKLFESCKKIPTTDQILQDAKVRFDLGNPPGKNKSYGDAVCWTSLLQAIDPGTSDLCFIARDKDYTSPLDKSMMSDFLRAEWHELKGSNVQYYNTLSSFFNEHFPKIKLASEIEKVPYIEDLVNSMSFASTHAAIVKLSNFSDFTDRELNNIIEAAVSNSQIYSILDDDDVYKFFDRLVKGNMGRIDPKTLKELSERYSELENDSGFEPGPPF
jgi:hypothetical protein